MSAPPTKINTLIQISNKARIDSVSKYFILLQVTCGLFRIPVLGVTKRCFVIMLFCLTVMYNAFITYLAFPVFVYHLAHLSSFIEFLFQTLLGQTLQRRLIHFYIEINKIDRDLSFKVTNHVILQYVIYFVQILAIVISFGVLFFFFPDIKYSYIVYLFPMKMLHYLELNYYGHLFSLIIPRLKLLKNIINVCYNTGKSNIEFDSFVDFSLFKKTQKKTLNYDVASLIYSYNNFIKAYDYLNSAIKWQMVITLIAIFFEGLKSSYHIAKLFLYGNEFENVSLLLYILFLILEFMPLMVPCLYANEVCNEIDQLREILTSRLYENRLDKNSRRAARALLDLLQTRPLYFSLLHMFNVDLALPFKILGLILTYLIILLQFDKIINPDQGRDTIA